MRTEQRRDSDDQNPDPRRSTHRSDSRYRGRRETYRRGRCGQDKGHGNPELKGLRGGRYISTMGEGVERATLPVHRYHEAQDRVRDADARGGSFTPSW